MSNYIYLLQEREFITTNQNIYKLGKTKQENLQRFKQYPKGSKLLLQQVCDGCDILEPELIRDFKNKYTHRKDIGNEYFEGDYNNMIKDIHNKITNNVIHNDNSVITEEIDINEDDFTQYYNDWDRWFKKNSELAFREPTIYEEKETNYRTKSNMRRIEEFNETNPYIITTYSEFKTITDIKHIVITNKKKQEGYILLDTSKEYLKIDSKFYKGKDAENLLGWLKHHTNDHFNKDDIWYYTISSFKKKSEYCMNYGISIGAIKPFECYYNKIIEDICDKCFDDTFKL
jgi:hypothetical protein